MHIYFLFLGNAPNFSASVKKKLARKNFPKLCQSFAWAISSGESSHNAIIPWA